MDNKTKNLTPRQERILKFLSDFIKKTGYPPSIREIASNFRIKSPKNAAKHLTALEKKGFIKRLKNLSRAMEVLAPSEEGFFTHRLPIAGRVSAGIPHLAVTDITGYVELDSGFFNCAGAFLLKAKGESMTGAGVDDGDYLVVRPQAVVLNNEIGVFMIDGEATVKRFFKDGGAVMLKPENPEFSPIIVKEAMDFSAIGKVISVIKRF